MGPRARGLFDLRVKADFWPARDVVTRPRGRQRRLPNNKSGRPGFERVANWVR